MFFHKIKELAETKPEKVALVHKEDVFTYQELWNRSVIIGYYLNQNFSDDRPVAIIGDKEYDVVAAIYGAIMARKPYVIIPSYYPPKRVEFILKDSESDSIIIPADIEIPDCELPLMNSKFFDGIEDEVPVDFSFEDDNYDLDKTALMIYTSGSTGEPKGVMISYKNVLASLNNIKTNYGFLADEGDYTEMNLSSFAFCASYGFPYFIGDAGCGYVCVPRKDLVDYRFLFDYIYQIQPTGFFCTPSLVEKLLTIEEFNEKDVPGLKILHFGGEPFSLDLYYRLKDKFPTLHLINGYGMSECISVGMLYHVEDDHIDENEHYMPIGLVEGSSVMLIDKEGNKIVEDNHQGEIVVYGNMVGKGYLHQPELTEKAFYELEDGTRAFRTHDLAVIRNGRYYFVGREDHQVKIGGNRVELPDAEANIKKCSIVQDCAMAIRKDPDTSLVAFVVLNQDGAAMKQAEAYLQIKKELKQFVESHMIPRKIIFLDELPRNINAKIDRSLLGKWAQK